MVDAITVQYLVSGTIIFLVLCNVVLSFNDIQDDTINFIIKKWAYSKYFFLTFAWGILGGHFFLGTKIPLFGDNWWLPVVLVVLVLVILFFIGKKQDDAFVMESKTQVLLLVLGVLYGHFFWSQRHLPEITFPFLN